MHDVLTKVIAQEAAKLDGLSLASPELLSEEMLKALEALSRCAKALKGDTSDPKKAPDPTTEEALATVGEDG